MIRFVFFVIMISCCASCTNAQYQGDNELELLTAKLNKLSFVKREAVVIENDSAIKFFFLQLQNNGPGQKINIVNIGDSHIQAGYFTGFLRRRFQHMYGNGGRGMMFPYRLAKSNGPFDYVSSTNVTWTYRRNVFADSSFSTGLAGFTIECDSLQGILCLTLRNNEGINYNFNHLQLFTDSKNDIAVTVYDSTGTIKATPHGMRSAAGVQQFDFDTAIQSACVHFSCTDSKNKTRITAINTYNDSAGVICHTIGVNGAEYEHFNGQPMFFEQLPLLQPNLIIVSLGTNEAYTTAQFSEAEFLLHVDSTINLLRHACGNVPILITSPAESGIKMKRKRVKVHPHMAKIHLALKQYCRSHHIPFFDLYTAAGGSNSFLHWRRMKMMDTNVVHFTREAYELHALLLWLALNKYNVER